MKRPIFSKDPNYETGKLSASQRKFAYSSISPIMLYIGFFSLLPILWALTMSFFNYTPVREGSWFLGLGGQNPFVGLKNYLELFAGNSKPASVFRQAIGNTFLFTALVVPLNLLITLPLSVMLENISEKFRTLFRAIYFLPTISSAIAVAVIWAYMYAPGYGLLSEMVRMFGFTPPKSWLSDPRAMVFGIPLAMLCVVIAYVWQDFGYNLVIFVAALQGIPTSIKEAAYIDGANSFQTFWFVIVPLLRGTILLTSVWTVLSSLQVFVIFQQLSRGGPRNQTQTMLLSIYENAFVFANNLGLAAAMSMILFMVILVFTVIQFRVLRSQWEY